MSYDAIVVGGGLGGSAIADQLARSGNSVLVLDRELKFRDRVRGENILAWGVAAGRRLGLYEDLIKAGAHVAPNWITFTMGRPAPPRDLRTTTPDGDAMLNIFHPDMQEALLARATAAGAEVKRGATVIGLESGPGKSPTVTYEHDGARQTATARIVVGADGRASQMRRWGGFEVQRNPDLLTIAGMLVDECSAPDERAMFCMGPGCGSFWAPLGGKRARVYFVYPGVAGRRGLSGNAKAAEFLQAVQSVGTPPEWLDGAQPAGPLAEFDGADHWVPSPAKNGVVLIGDAAASSDPSWGSGLSLTLLDVEHLATALRENTDWHAAIARYAGEHDEYYGALHRMHGWWTELAWTPGPEADARRMRVFPRMAMEPSGFPDVIGLGPVMPSDELERRLTFGRE